jgi:perosamine synthetase
MNKMGDQIKLAVDSAVMPADRRQREDFGSSLCAPDTHIEADQGSFRDSIGKTIFTFWKGRVALFATLKALGIGHGDRVIVPGFTCFVVPSAVGFAGAEPVYADIEPSTFNLTVETIATAEKSSGGKAKAIIIQHTFGIPADTSRIVSWAHERGIATIEDCAHALGTRYRDQNGSWRNAGELSDAAFFSSHWSKPISTGIGGWVTANDSELCRRLRRFWTDECVFPSTMETALLAMQVGVRQLLTNPRIYWTIRNAYHALYRRGILVGSSSPRELEGAMPEDYAKRMSAFQERLLNKRLEGGASVQYRRELKTCYDRAFQAAGFPPLSIPEHADPVLLRYPLRVKNKTRILAEAKKRGFEIGEWYMRPVDVPEELDLSVVGYRSGMCPEGERASREVIHFPMGRNISSKYVAQMVDFVKSLA